MQGLVADLVDSAVAGQGRELHAASDRGGYFNQPRRRKYHIGTTALAAIRISAYG